MRSRLGTEMRATGSDNLPGIQIRGHGLAGALLAEVLSAAGFPLKVTDDGGPCSSRVAAGLYTPLTGKRMIPGWRLEDALPRVYELYPRLETELGIRFHHRLDTVRIFRDEAQRTEAETRGPRNRITLEDVSRLPFHAPFGGCRITGGGWVNLPLLLDGLAGRRRERKEWGELDHPDLTIWAQGARASADPRWAECGWRNAHGDVLTVEIDGLPEESIFHFGRFLIPLGNHRFRCGATYAWNIPGPEPRPEGRGELESELGNSLRLPFRVTEHRAGIRPVALARVPIAGPHPEDPAHWIFNGFGSKGVLYAPWMAERLRDCLLKGHPLPRDTQAARRIQRQRDREKTREGRKKSHREK